MSTELTYEEAFEKFEDAMGEVLNVAIRDGLEKDDVMDDVEDLIETLLV